MRESLQNIINKISYEERRKKELESVQFKLNKYINMSNDEFLMEYTNIISRFEYKRNMFSLVVVTVFLTTITGCWKYFFDIFNSLFLIDSSELNGLKEQALMFIIIIFLLIIVVLIFSLVKMALNLNRLNREKILIEQIEKIRKQGSSK